jgi:hypothetical protein
MNTNHYHNYANHGHHHHGNKYIDIINMPTTSAKRLEIFGVNNTSGYSATAAHQLSLISLTPTSGRPTASNNFIDAVDFSGCTEIRTAMVGGQFSSGSAFNWGSANSGSSVANNLYRSGTSSSPGTDGLTEIRAVNCRFAGGGTHTTGHGSAYHQFGGLNVSNNVLSAAALNQLFTDLANASGGGTHAILTKGCTGASSATNSTATGKGYTVFHS